MFFEDKEALKSFLKDEAMSTRAELLVTSIRGGGGAGDSKVLSVEPREFVPLTEQFYLLPILEHADVRFNRRSRVILKVASINQNEPPEQQEASQGPYNVGIVFVIDHQRRCSLILTQHEMRYVRCFQVFWIQVPRQISALVWLVFGAMLLRFLA